MLEKVILIFILHLTSHFLQQNIDTCHSIFSSKQTSQHVKSAKFITIHSSHNLFFLIQWKQTQ